MKSVITHLFFIVIEVVLLAIQYQRSEVFAFEVLPELADAKFGVLYGSQLFGAVWVLIVVLFTYLFWELYLSMIDKGINKLAFGIVAVLNIAVCVGELTFFSKLVENDNTGFLAYLVGFLLVASHQVSSFWIMKNVIGEFFNHEKRN